MTIIDQQVGEFFIQDLRNHDIPIQVITTQKDLKDPKLIEKIKVMDKIEMTHFVMVALRQNHQIEFPEQATTNCIGFREADINVCRA